MDTFFAKKEGILDGEISKKAGMLQELVKDLNEKMTSSLRVSPSKFDLEFVPDDKKLVHGIKKCWSDGSLFVLHNFTSARREHFEIKFKKEHLSEGKPEIIFTSDDKKYGGEGSLSPIAQIREEGDFAVFAVTIPANTSLIVKSGKS